MTKKQKAAPLPLELPELPWDMTEEGHNPGGFFISGSCGSYIAEGLDKDAAALIVRAVNSHAALVEATREALEALDHWEGKNETSEKLRAALKLAGEEI